MEKLPSTEAMESHTPIDTYEKDRNLPPERTHLGLRNAQNATAFGCGAVSSLKLDDLPEEVLLSILSFLPPSALVFMSLVSVRWHHLLNDAGLWRAKLVECLPGHSAAAPLLHRLQATLPREDGDETHLNDQWLAVRYHLGFFGKVADRSLSADAEVSDLRRLYMGDEDEALEGDDEVEADAVIETADVSAKDEDRPLLPTCDEAIAEPLPHDGEAAAGKKTDEQAKPEGDSEVQPSVPEPNWRYTCLTLLKTERNWWRGDIRPVDRVRVPSDALCLDFDEEQQLLVTGCKNKSRGELAVWHLRTGEPLFSFEGHRWWVNDVHIRGDRVISCSNDATVTVWSLKDRSMVKALQGHGAGVQSISFHPRLPHIVLSGSWDNTVKLWDLNTGDLLDTFNTSGDQAWGVGVSDKGMLMCVGQAGWLCAWDYRQRAQLFTHQPKEMQHSVGTFRYRTGFHCVQFTEAGDRCVVAGSHLPSSALSPAGGLGASDGQRELDGIIQEYDLSGGEPQWLRTFKGTHASIRSIQFDQGKLVAGDYDSRIKVWDMATGTLQTNFKNWLPASFEPSATFENHIFKLKYSPTGLLVTGESNSVGVFDLSGRRKPRPVARIPCARPAARDGDDASSHDV